MIYKSDFKFGMTNLGDAGVDLSWTERINSTIGSIIISKEANEEFAKALLKYRDKIIYHVAMTGFGNTDLEPGAPSIDTMIEHLKYIIYRGFNPNQIVLKIDPIMPYCWVDIINGLLKIDYLENLKYILSECEKLEIKRVRHSFLSFNPCVLTNLHNFNPAFTIPDDWKYMPDEEIPLYVLNNNFIFESKDLFNPYTNHIPPVSNEDLFILGLNNDYRFDTLYDHSKNILELLNGKRQCKIKCAYCEFEHIRHSFLDFSKTFCGSNKVYYDFGEKTQTYLGDYSYTYIAYASDNKGSNFSLVENKKYLKWYSKITSPEKIEKLNKEEFDRRSSKWIKYVFDDIGEDTGKYDIIDGFSAELIGTIISSDENLNSYYNDFRMNPKVKYGNTPYENQQYTYIPLNGKRFIGIKNIKVSDRMKLLDIKVSCQTLSKNIIEIDLVFNEKLNIWLPEEPIFFKIKSIIKLKISSIYERYSNVEI